MWVAESQNPMQSLNVLPPPPGVLCADSLGLVPGDSPSVPDLALPPPDAIGGGSWGDSGETCCCWGAACPSPGVGVADGVFGTKPELPGVEDGPPGCSAEGAGLDGIAEGGVGTKREPGVEEGTPGLAAGAAAPPDEPLPDCANAQGAIRPNASTAAMAVILFVRVQDIDPSPMCWPFSTYG